MKKLFNSLLLISLAALPLTAQANQINSTISQNAIDWNDQVALDALSKKLIDNYKNNQPKAISHQLYEQDYNNNQNTPGKNAEFEFLISLEKFAFDYASQNPKAVDVYLKKEPTASFWLTAIQNELQKQANTVGVNLSTAQIKILATLQFSLMSINLQATPGLPYHTLSSFSLLKEIVEYANQQIQNNQK
jgi:hypothetical protein